MATTKITNPELFDLASLDSALQLPSGTTAERPTSPSTGEWRYNTDDNKIEFYDGSFWLAIQDEVIPPVPSENFSAITYTGTVASTSTATQSITGLGFQPDVVWIKQRSSTAWHHFTDSSRGGTPNKSVLFTNTTNAEGTGTQNYGGVVSYDSDGFTLQGGPLGSNNVCELGSTYVAWCWKVNGGTTSSNTDGTITSTVQVNSKAKFSVVQYTANAVSGATIGHGLGVEPDIVIVKNTNTSTESWNTYVKDVTTTNAQFLTLNTTNANGNTANPRFIPGNFSSSVFSVGNDNSTNGVSGVDTYIAYCFASVAGFSKIGSYTGTGAAGNQQNTGFEPAFVLIKRTDSLGAWSLYDNKRNTTNPRNLKLVPNDNAAENVAGTTYQLNFFTNGFDFLGGGSDLNASGGTFIYIAFASDPSAAPVLADSFNTNLYTGNGGTQNITGLGFSPNFVWLKERSAAESHRLFDTTRGATQRLFSNSTSAQSTASDSLTSFNSDGFSLGVSAGVNENSQSYVAWNWKANPIPTINTEGSVTTVVSANQAAGFSIVAWTGGSSGTATTGHGLSAAPELIIQRPINAVSEWYIWHKDLTSGNSLKFTTAAESTAVAFTVGSSIWSTNWTNTVYNWIAYCFHSVSGFSKFGSYTGNGGSNSITTGFQPDWVLIKDATSTGSWFIYDNERTVSVGSNPGTPNARPYIIANSSGAENGVTTYNIDLDSNGFSMNTSSTELNDSGQTYIYAAFKENPTPQPSAGNMSFLVVAGGGGGAVSAPGGGGAGGLRTSYGGISGGGASSESDITLASGTYTITVGSGGAGAFPSGANGVNSSIAATGITTITSLGGGGGNRVANVGLTGGSGGGSGETQLSTGGSGTANQGYDGGYGNGGGGGARGPGNNGYGAGVNLANNGGIGGDGLAVSITGSSVTYASGGSAYYAAPSPTLSPNPTAGGGGGASVANGVANSGGGGRADGGDGGSGVIILRLLTSEYSGTTTGSPTVTTNGDYTVLTYTGSGTYVHS